MIRKNVDIYLDLKIVTIFYSPEWLCVEYEKIYSSEFFLMTSKINISLYNNLIKLRRMYTEQDLLSVKKVYQ